MDCSIAYDYYPRKIIDNAETLLKRLFAAASKQMSTFEKIDILVIGYGSFPSFLPFINSIKNTYPNIKTLNFSLVDPDFGSTNYFEEILPKLTRDIIININTETYRMCLDEFIRTASGKCFDMIYFENPDASFLNSLFPTLNYRSTRLSISMLESIPYLQNIIRLKTIFIASFISNEDLHNMLRLLKFSLNIKHNVAYKRININSIYFNKGLIGILNKLDLPGNSSDKLRIKIQHTRRCFNIFVLLSFILFLFSPVPIKIISFYFVIAQLFYHQYGVKGNITRLLLLSGQLALSFLTFNYLYF